MMKIYICELMREMMTYILYIGYQNKNLYTERYITGSSAYSSISFYNYDYNFVHNQRGIIIIL